jgi:hypothetical protein
VELPWQQDYEGHCPEVTSPVLASVLATRY